MRLFELTNGASALAAKTKCFVGLLMLGLWSELPAHAADPVVSNVRATQRAGTKQVDIYYDLADADSGSLTVTVAVSTNGGASYNLSATSFTGALGAGVAPGSNKQITWNAGADWNGKFSANVRFQVTADDAVAPVGMALIPAGSFTMGATTNMGHESYSDEVPQHTVYVSAFYMDRYEVTMALWDEVYNWATNHGYSFEHGAQGKASTHPAYAMSWYDAVKWCNARSEQEGRTPVYYTSAGQTTVYRSGEVTVRNDYVKWSSGYRLPTEAEWEKAARGGSSGQRFPFGNTINQSQANYWSYWSNGVPYFPYDVTTTSGFHPTFNDGIYPYTSPAGYFAPNGYGLYDMTGNVGEWCWDWYSDTYYSVSPATDPRGPASTATSNRVIRGGGWEFSSSAGCRTASREYSFLALGYWTIGFRCVRSAAQ